MTLNRGHRYRERIGAGAGQTAFEYLAGRYPHSSPETWRARFAAGEVELRGVRAQGGEVLRGGDLLVWNRPPWREEAAPLHYEVLHHDPALLAVSKPAGLPTMPAGGFLQHTLLALIERDYPGYAPMHRLGRGTSGLVLFAAQPARAEVLGQWRAGAVEKHYLALAQGEAAPGIYDLHTPIGPVAHPRLGTVYAASPQGKPAHSRAQVLWVQGGVTCFAVQIFSGRPHQIRIHLAALGFPLRGDPLYLPGGQPRPDALPGDTGYGLHAHRLALCHPRSGERWETVAPPPAEYRALQ